MDIIDDGANGFLVSIDNVGALADRLERVLEMTPEAWRRMSDAAFATAHRYTWEDAVILLERALKLTIDRSNRGELERKTMPRRGVSV